MGECFHPTYIAIGHWDGKIPKTGKGVYGTIAACSSCGQETYLFPKDLSDLSNEKDWAMVQGEIREVFEMR